jgi:hypothetical protein
LQKALAIPAIRLPNAFREREDPMRKRAWVPCSRKRDRFAAAK